MLHVVIFAFGISVGAFLGAYLANKEFQAKINGLFKKKSVEDKSEEKK